MTRRSLLSACACLCAGWTPAGADPLPHLVLDPAGTTVSGLSSGAFMAVQLQVAFSQAILGAGVVAGGPFGCAEGLLWRALHVCMDPFFVSADPQDSLAVIRSLDAEDAIDPAEFIASDRVYLFHGRADGTVDRTAMDALAEMYGLLGVPSAAISYVDSFDAGHGFVTEAGSLTCDATGGNFLIDCDFDQAGDILTWLYGALDPAGEDRPDALLSFDQSAYAGGAAGMDDTGFVYVPEACAAGETCRLHIALHGCKQGRERLGSDFARLTGYNRWAESNAIVVIYPQAISIPAPWYDIYGGNPNGCWDWWGYSGDDYLGRSGPQLAAIARMAAALGAPLSP
ncbi:hypothetical protein AB1M95_15090 [Sulfitobacter sp. LCG007]